MAGGVGVTGTADVGGLTGPAGGCVGAEPTGAGAGVGALGAVATGLMGPGATTGAGVTAGAAALATGAAGAEGGTAPAFCTSVNREEAI